jgi:hypothetical protein
MVANKLRGEVSFPKAGKGAFIMFNLSDLVSLEEAYGEDFFGVIENGITKVSPKIITDLSVRGIRLRDAADKAVPVYKEVDDIQFALRDACEPIMDALSMAWTQKTYKQLIDEVQTARKKQITEAAKELKEAADEAGVPFSEEVLASAIFKLGIVQA